MRRVVVVLEVVVVARLAYTTLTDLVHRERETCGRRMVNHGDGYEKALGGWEKKKR